MIIEFRVFLFLFQFERNFTIKTKWPSGVIAFIICGIRNMSRTQISIKNVSRTTACCEKAGQSIGNEIEFNDELEIWTS